MLPAPLLCALAIVSGWRHANRRRYPKTARIAGDLSDLAMLGVLCWGLLYIPLASYLLLSKIVTIGGWNAAGHLHPAGSAALLMLAGVSFVAAVPIAAQAKSVIAKFAGQPKLVLLVLAIATVGVMPIGQAIGTVVTAATAEKAANAVPLMFVTGWTAGIALVCSSVAKACVDIWQQRLKVDQTTR